MDGTKTGVLSFLDNLEKTTSLQNALNATNNDPDIKARRLQATKDAGKIECLRYIFRDLCKKSTPDVEEINPGRLSGSAPDLDHVIDKVMSTRTGGNDFVFYVKEALKRGNSPCLKSMAESVDKLINTMYFEKDIHPESIEASDFDFKITPQIEDRLQQIIADNQLDALSEVIKDNVKADAVDEITAAKKEREERMKLEDELMNDPTVTSEAALNDALRKKGLTGSPEVYQPSLFEAVMVKAFNSMDDGSVSVGKSITIPAVGMVAVTPNAISMVSDMGFDTSQDGELGMGECQVKVSACINKITGTFVNRYYSRVDSEDPAAIIPTFSEQVKSIKIDGSQEVSVVDLESYKISLKEYRDAIASCMKSGEPVPPIEAPRMMEELRAIPEIMRKAYEIMVDAVHDFVDPAAMSDYINTIPVKSVCTALGVSSSAEISRVARLCAMALTTKLEYFNASLNVFATSLECAKRVNAIVSDVDAKATAFNAAVCEYTVLNALKALKTEEFDPNEVKRMAREYIQKK